jgi:hypothetical protein
MATFSNANANGVVYMSDIQKRPAFFMGWERLRHGKLHWFAECFAEAVRLSITAKLIEMLNTVTDGCLLLVRLL